MWRSVLNFPPVYGRPSLQNTPLSLSLCRKTLTHHHFGALRRNAAPKIDREGGKETLRNHPWKNQYHPFRFNPARERKVAHHRWVLKLLSAFWPAVSTGGSSTTIVPAYPDPTLFPENPFRFNPRLNQRKLFWTWIASLLLVFRPLKISGCEGFSLQMSFQFRREKKMRKTRSGRRCRRV